MRFGIKKSRDFPKSRKSRLFERCFFTTPEGVAEEAVKAESGVAKVNGATSAKAVQGTTAQASQVGASQAVSGATVATAQTTAQAAAGAATGGASAAATAAASVAKGIVSSAAQSSAPTMTMTMK